MYDRPSVIFSTFDALVYAVESFEGEKTHAMQTPGPRIDAMHLASAVTPF